MCASDITTIQLHLGQEIGRGERKNERRKKRREGEGKEAGEEWRTDGGMERLEVKRELRICGSVDRTMY